MTATELAALVGKKITFTDHRTQAKYRAKIIDARKGSYGRGVEVSVSEGKWVQPTETELQTVGD